MDVVKDGITGHGASSNNVARTAHLPYPCFSKNTVSLTISILRQKGYIQNQAQAGPGGTNKPKVAMNLMKQHCFTDASHFTHVYGSM